MIIKDSSTIAKQENAPPKEPPVLNKLIETISDDLNGDGVSDTIRLIQDTGTVASDWFNKLTLSVSGHKKQTFKNPDGWGVIDSFFLAKNKNKIQSNRIYIYKDSAATLLLLFGVQYEDGRDGTVIIKIDTNTTKKIFTCNWDIIKELKDIDGDGNIDLAAKSHSEMFSNDEKGTILTYDPSFVYTIKGFECKLNNALSKTYNEEFYVWAGLHPTKEIKVFHPRDGGKPKIVK